MLRAQVLGKKLVHYKIKFTKLRITFNQFNQFGHKI